MNLTIPKCLAAAIVCGATLISGKALGQAKNVLIASKGAYGNSVKSTATLSHGTTCTMTCFAKLDKTGSKAMNDLIMGVSGLKLGYDPSTGRITLTYKVNTYNSGSLSCDAPSDGKWHHYAAIIQASVGTCIYIDGVVTASNTAGTWSGDPAGVVAMCRGNGRWESESSAFAGCLAEVSMWGRALSEAEIKAMMAERPDSVKLSNGCFGFWPMDEGDGGETAKDLLGKYDLTLNPKTVYVLGATDDFPNYSTGDSRIFVPITRAYPTNLVDVAIGAGASMKDGMFEKDKPVTFTATAKDPSVKFVRWYGAVTEDEATNATIEILADKEMTLIPYFAFDWAYDATTKTITDGYWTVDATVTSGTTSIKTGKAKTGLPLPLLDLSKPVRDTEETSYSITAMGGFESGGGAFEGKTFIQEVVLPMTLTKAESLLHNYWSHGVFKGCTALQKVTPFMSPAFESMGEQMFFGCSSLGGDLVLGGGAADLILSETVTGDGSVYGQQFANTKITSVRVCANVPKLPSSVFNGCSALTNVVFEKDGVPEIRRYAFENCRAVKSFTMLKRPTIMATAFNGWTSNQCRFVVHASDPGWAAYMAKATNFIAWGALDAATREGYKTKFPGAKRPLGLSLTLPKNQWLCGDSASGLAIVVE